MSNWRECPTYAEFYEKNCDYVAFIDESGTGNMKSIKKYAEHFSQLDDNIRYFAITAVIMNRNQFKKCSVDGKKLKEKHWLNGEFDSRDVCFHTRDINKQEGAFGKNQINYDEFIVDLSIFLGDIDCSVITIFVDKAERYKQFGDTCLNESLYELCIYYLLEKISYATKQHKIALMFESRGKKKIRAY